MTRVRLSDLPPKVRARVIDQLATDIGAQIQRKRRSRAGVGDGAPCPGTCHTCGERFPNAAAWQRHADAIHAGNARWDIDLDHPTTTPPHPPES
jgi:hypothetical protein